VAQQKMYGPYPAVVLSEHDGDTQALQLDLGFNIGFKCSCRTWRINAPELNTDEGKAALAYALEICPVGTNVSVLSHGWDKYHRFDGQMTLPDGSDFATRMLDAGHAVVYP
jgi:endonuclease YncB( thermonuclease family)